MDEEREWNRKLMEEFRANGGVVGGHFTGKTLLLLHTIGVKSGLTRINPVAYVRDGERYVIIASNSGAPQHPSWYHNLLANPHAWVEVGMDTFPVEATLAVEEEWTRLFDAMVAMMPIFDRYRQEAARQIPVVILTRVK